MFQLKTDFSPRGDQPKAIEGLVQGLYHKKKSQVLLGITGSGKTFTMASVIAMDILVDRGFFKRLQVPYLAKS